MTEIVLGVGTSHGPLLNTPPGDWDQRAAADRRNPALMYQGRPWSYDDLRAARDDFAPQVEPAVREERHARSRAALAALGRTIAEVDPDVLVIVSSDHKELFGDELLPAFGVYWGAEVDHQPLGDDELAAMGPGLAVSARGYVPDVPTKRACAPELAAHLISELIAGGFDVAASERLPPGKHGDHGLPHGWGFVFQQVLERPLPIVPVFVNTFYPPNQPTPARCYAFGQALRRAVEGAPGGQRVAFVASGGLTHFVVDEEFDQAFLTALAEDDERHLAGIDPAWLESGSSEMRNWIVVAGAMSGTGTTFKTVDYVPCYRAEAGTGNAMGFATWL
ncbi:hypothetical protein [Spongiactinospora sp. TRM90649]|uniref:DODA-type extradiol aromatic ring-opening family dioxygenase n=1 Tax=Spongiactinospora sp. TRM90649 TaxID=3031114 RepID=UPI0023F91784|nr:hypothetical protein [Spongiactinospora sp. TRM90649]MDF5756941.1 hypothetical protein [Spongiactinospora sp. TRM90649]